MAEREAREDRLAIGGFSASPASVFKRQGNQDAERYRRDIVRARAEGHAEGRSEARSQVVDFLHKKYLDPKLSRESPEAHAILEITRVTVEFLNGADVKKRR